MLSWGCYLKELANKGESFIPICFSSLEIWILNFIKKGQPYTGYNNSEYITSRWLRGTPLPYEEQYICIDQSFFSWNPRIQG